MGLVDTYTWVGYQRNIESYLARSDVFVLPSLWGEGTPTSILEAMLLKKPVVATDNGGVRELVHDMTTGLLIQPGDSKRLAMAIETILLNRRFNSVTC